MNYQGSVEFLLDDSSWIFDQIEGSIVGMFSYRLGFVWITAIYSEYGRLIARGVEETTEGSIQAAVQLATERLIQQHEFELMVGG